MRGKAQQLVTGRRRVEVAPGQGDGDRRVQPGRNALVVRQYPGRQALVVNAADDRDQEQRPVPGRPEPPVEVPAMGAIDEGRADIVRGELREGPAVVGPDLAAVGPGEIEDLRGRVVGDPHRSRIVVVTESGQRAERSVVDEGP